MSALEIALIVVLTSAASALLSAALMSVLLIGKQRRRERNEDQAALAGIAGRLNHTVELAARETKESLKEIHTLVNSQLTDAKVSELDSARLTLILAKRIIARDDKEGITPTQEDRDIIGATQSKIEALEALVKDRATQQAKVDAQMQAAE